MSDFSLDLYQYTGNYPRKKHRTAAAGIAMAYGVTRTTATNLLMGDKRFRILMAARVLGPVRCYKSKSGGWHLDGRMATPEEIYDAAREERERQNIAQFP